MHNQDLTQKQELTAKEAVAALLESLGFTTMARECREEKAPVTRFTPLVLREIEKRHPDKLAGIRSRFVALDLIHF